MLTDAGVRTQPVVQLFSNPASGGYSAQRIRALTAALEARAARVLHTRCGSGTPVIDPQATHVCVAGGDGTVRHVAAAVARGKHPVAMSIYPAGTVNLIAKEAGYPAEPALFADLVLGPGRKRQHHAVTLGESHFFACAAVGPDSFAVATVSLPLKRRIGRFAYVVSLIRLFSRWRRHRITLKSEDREVQCEAFYVAKGRYYAGRWSLAPLARVDEPALHVVALTTARRLDYIRFTLGLACGRDPKDQKGVQAFTCRTLAISSDQPLPLQADGDIVGEVPAVMAIADEPLVFC